jgi:hypothetical protein
MKKSGEANSRLFPALLIGFGAQIAGRLIDLQWHLTHEEFEGAVEQLQAHWLIWLTTVFVIGVAAIGCAPTSRASGVDISSFCEPRLRAGGGNPLLPAPEPPRSRLGPPSPRHHQHRCGGGRAVGRRRSRKEAVA